MSRPAIGRFIAIPTLAVVSRRWRLSATWRETVRYFAARVARTPAAWRDGRPTAHPCKRTCYLGQPTASAPTANLEPHPPHPRRSPRHRPPGNTALRQLKSGKRFGPNVASGIGKAPRVNAPSLLRSKRSQVRILAGVPRREFPLNAFRRWSAQRSGLLQSVFTVNWLPFQACG